MTLPFIMKKGGWQHEDTSYRRMRRWCRALSPDAPATIGEKGNKAVFHLFSKL